ncbi:hypothetical protein V6N12_028348 [Hibiscus sabdariffa]|uniref:Uncharacterized protein n=1 Tax=Hibiscus sabdariffa TaxID=183260 RepID=A0ABR2F5L1_9ROSI
MASTTMLHSRGIQISSVYQARLHNERIARTIETSRDVESEITRLKSLSQHQCSNKTNLVVAATNKVHQTRDQMFNHSGSTRSQDSSTKALYAKSSVKSPEELLDNAIISHVALIWGARMPIIRGKASTNSIVEIRPMSH